ncbi:DUF551 domain-containing protein [Klebsiella pneumoniae]|nr:DUF551 domain-containing protein [Klebsiella pneumoniae]HDY9179184.1 DUF551 domain-containing protein [Klebsiella pneumoniae]HDY9187186.1 DUF551 domain-containing protein [Klebsiella pneumoniae]
MKFEEWLSQQNGVIEVDCGCVTSEAFYHWMRVAYEAGNSQVIPDGWTCNDKANAALMMLDRIETVDPVDDDRIDGIKRIVRELAAAQQSPGSEPDTVPGKWIPVSEQMPEDAQWCVVITEYGYYVQCWSDGQGWLGDDISIPNVDVTHWMPLPAAPQEVKP